MRNQTLHNPLYIQHSGIQKTNSLHLSNFFQQPRDYHFDYAVSDPHTGDHKSQWEVKEKGVVKGGYSLVEPDGTTRVVEYIADDHGFRAVVKKLGTPIYPSAVHAEIPSGITPYAPAPPLPIKESYEQQQLPLFEEYKGAYNGQYQNYFPELKQPQYIYPAAPVKVEQQYYQPQQYYQQPAPLVSYYPKPVEAPKPAPVVTYEAKQEEPEERVEYHGFTGNSDDDSAYTKYEDGEGEKEEYNEGSEEDEEESKQKILAVPYKLVQGYQKQPLVYLIKQYPGY